jgi:hypothetical protein
MLKKLDRNGAFSVIKKFKIISRKLAANGAFQIVDNSRESLRVEPLHAQQQEVILAEFRKRLPAEVDLHLNLTVASVLLIDKFVDVEISLKRISNGTYSDREY